MEQGVESPVPENTGWDKRERFVNFVKKPPFRKGGLNRDRIGSVLPSLGNGFQNGGIRHGFGQGRGLHLLSQTANAVFL